MSVLESPNSSINKFSAPVGRAGAGEMEAVVSVLTAAFTADPALRRLYPDAHQFRTHFPAFVRAFGGRALGAGTALCVRSPHAPFAEDAAAEGMLGAALWLPPGVYADEEALGALLAGSVAPADRDVVYPLFEQMAHWHPEEPVWYLSLLGVDPPHQRRGWGAALLEPVLEACDREGVPAYLESSNAANVSLYERHGFRVLATLSVDGTPPIRPMLREPRRR